MSKRTYTVDWSYSLQGPSVFIKDVTTVEIEGDYWTAVAGTVRVQLSDLGPVGNLNDSGWLCVEVDEQNRNLIVPFPLPTSRIVLSEHENSDGTWTLIAGGIAGDPDGTGGFGGQGNQSGG